MQTAYPALTTRLLFLLTLPLPSSQNCSTFIIFPHSFRIVRIRFSVASQNKTKDFLNGGGKELKVEKFCERQVTPLPPLPSPLPPPPSSLLSLLLLRWICSAASSECSRQVSAKVGLRSKSIPWPTISMMTPLDADFAQTRVFVECIFSGGIRECYEPTELTHASHHLI